MWLIQESFQSATVILLSCCIYRRSSCSVRVVSDACRGSILHWSYMHSIVPERNTATSARATVDDFRPQCFSTVAKSLIEDEINTRVDCTFAVGQEPHDEVDMH